MNVPRLLARNFLQLLASNVIGQLFFLLALLHIAKVVGPASFGLWNLAQAWSMYLFRFGEMGLEVVGIRMTAQQPLRAGAIVWNVVLLRLLILVVLIMFVVAFAWLHWFPSGSENLIVVFSLTLLPLALTLEWVFESHQSVALVGLARMIRGLLFCVPVLLVVSTKEHILDAAYFYVGSFLIASLMVGIGAVRRFRLFPGRIDLHLAKQMLSAAVPIGLATVLSQYSLFIGTILLGFLGGGEELGFYTAAHRIIVFFWAYGVVTANRVLLPQLSRLFHASSESLGEFVLKAFRLLIIFSLPLLIVGIAGGEGIMLLLYGSKYSPSAPVFEILSVILVITSVRSIFEVGLLASNRQNLFMIGMVGVALLTTALTYAGIQRNGITGAAAGSLMAEAVYTCYVIGVSRCVSVSRILAIAWKPILFAVGVLCAILFAGISSLAVIIVGGIGSYVGLLLVTRQVTRKDLDFVVNMLSPGH